ncbi:MAG: NfeD family protein [Clostridia bacterium]|nr:NfeD family protein [Clostridia bacterium]
MGIFSLLGKKGSQEKPFTPENIIGKKCVVTETVDNYAGCGQVRVNGQGWSARAARDEEVFDVGETLSIVAIEGVRLVCVKN